MTDIFETLESEVRCYSRNWNIVFNRAAGSMLYGEDGSQYLDFFSGAGALNYGHNSPELLRPLIEYIQSGAIVHSLDMKTPAKRRFLEVFHELILMTGNSMKRRGAGIPLTNTSSMPYDGFFEGQILDFLWLRHALEDSGSGLDKPAAVIVETVQGEGGLRADRASWLRGLSELCQQHGILLIVDNVQAGCGRTGTYFSFEEAGIVPDIVCLSKSISGFGLPMALMLFKPELDIWKPGEHNGTFRGHNPAFVTGAAALEHFWQDGKLESHVAGIASQLHDGLKQIADASKGAAVRGRGLLAGIYYPDPQAAGKIAAEAFARGLLVETSGPEGEVVKTMPRVDHQRRGSWKRTRHPGWAAESVTGDPIIWTSYA